MNVLICSAATVGPNGFVVNVGDEALTQCIAEALRRRFPNANVEATLNRQDGGPLPDDRVAVRPFRELVAAVRRADVVIFGGGTLLQEDRAPSLLRPIAGLLRYGIAVSFAAAILRRRFVVFSVGVERLDSRRAQIAAWLICRLARSVTVRDRQSVGELKSATGVVGKLAADPLFIDRGLFLSSEGDRSGRLAVNLRSDAPNAFVVALAQAVNAGRWSSVLLVPMDRSESGDLPALTRFESLLSVPTAVVPGYRSWEEVIEEIGKCEAAIGMRLHFLIFAAIRKLRVLPIVSSPKTAGLVEDLGLVSASLAASRDDLCAFLNGAATASDKALLALNQRALEGLEILGKT